MERSEIIKVAGAVILPNLGSFYNGYITRKNISPWYENLKFPSYRPPKWVFPPVWTTLYSSMGYASYLVWKEGGGFEGKAQIPLILFGTQLALNWAWTPIFFGRHDLKNSAIEIVALTAAATATGISFYNISPLAGLIFVPYVAWLTYATILNHAIYRLNKDKESDDTPTIEEKKL